MRPTAPAATTRAVWRPRRATAPCYRPSPASGPRRAATACPHPTLRLNAARRGRCGRSGARGGGADDAGGVPPGPGEVRPPQRAAPTSARPAPVARLAERRRRRRRRRRRGLRLVPRAGPTMAETTAGVPGRGRRRSLSDRPGAAGPTAPALTGRPRPGGECPLVVTGPRMARAIPRSAQGAAPVRRCRAGL